MEYVIIAAIVVWIGVSVFTICKKKLIGKCSCCDGSCKGCSRAKR